MIAVLVVTAVATTAATNKPLATLAVEPALRCWPRLEPIATSMWRYARVNAARHLRIKAVLESVVINSLPAARRFIVARKVVPLQRYQALADRA